MIDRISHYKFLFFDLFAHKHNPVSMGLFTCCHCQFSPSFHHGILLSWFAVPWKEERVQTGHLNMWLTYI